MQKDLICKTGLKKNIVKKDVFERELELCKKLSQENNGKCGWGKCNTCGVIPLLYKLHGGVLVEDKRELKNIRKEILNS